MNGQVQAESLIGSHPNALIGSNLMRPWLVANTIAFAVAGAVSGWLVRTIGQPYYGNVASIDEAVRVQLTAVTPALTVFGLVIGTAQWLVLRRVIDARLWLIATALSWGLVGVVIGVASGLGGGAMSGIGPSSGPLDGTLLAVIAITTVTALIVGPQWLILRGQAQGASSWIVGSVGGLFAGLMASDFVVLWMRLVGMLSATSDFPSAKAWFVVGLITGPLYGLVTWPALRELRPWLALAARRP